MGLRFEFIGVFRKTFKNRMKKMGDAILEGCLNYASHMFDFFSFRCAQSKERG